MGANRIHLSNDVEKYIYEIIPMAVINTTQWRLREKLMYIVKHWRSKKYRVAAIDKEAQFYLDKYNTDLGEESINNRRVAWAYCRCVELAGYLDKNS